MFEIVFRDPVVVEKETLLVCERRFDQAFIH
jgi:hypothetical protein